MDEWGRFVKYLMSGLVVFDLNGVLTEVPRRFVERRPESEQEWLEYFGAEEAPIGVNVRAAQEASAASAEVWVVTGRPDLFRKRTEAQLRQMGVPFVKCLMRTWGDRRPSEVLKGEWARMAVRASAASPNEVSVWEDDAGDREVWRLAGCTLCGKVDWGEP